MLFCKLHLRQRRTYKEYKVKLEEKNYYLYSKLQIEVNSNHQNERQINQLKQEYCISDMSKKFKISIEK